MTDIIIVPTVILLLIIICVVMMIADIRSVNKIIRDTDEPTKRYIYTILGKSSTNGVLFRYRETDTKLTYQEIKDSFSDMKVMSISVLDTKEGKF